MSATMSGLDSLKLWLNKTEIYECAIRPVPLNEYTLLNGQLTEHPPLPFLEPEKIEIQNDLNPRKSLS